MMCAASGLAKEGFIPFATTYATFIARRCYDFISQAICEHNTNVKIIGGRVCSPATVPAIRLRTIWRFWVPCPI